MVAVPIGHLEDITLRALRTLREATVIACEDTRRTSQLLELLGVARPRLVAFHEHNEEAKTPLVIEVLESGRDVALVSDAGTPTISDPGYPLLKAAVTGGYTVVPIPGPCAAITALSASGLPTDRFRFVGFPPAKLEARRRFLEELSGATETLILYVGPHDLDDILALASEVFGPSRPAVVARELTKMYEEFRRDTLLALSTSPGKNRGEIVLLIGGRESDEAPTEDDLQKIAQTIIDEGFGGARAAKELTRRTGANRDEAYRAILRLRAGEQETD